jgi:hypothetical protein
MIIAAEVSLPLLIDKHQPGGCGANVRWASGFEMAPGRDPDAPRVRPRPCAGGWLVPRERAFGATQERKRR